MADESKFQIRKGDDENDKLMIVLARKLDSHISDFNRYKEEMAERNRLQDEAYQNTMQAINALTAATQGAVDAWNTANHLQRFFKWLSGFAVVGVILNWVYTHIITTAGKG